MIILTAEEQRFDLPLAGADPVVSIKPRLHRPGGHRAKSLQREDLVFLAAQDDDPFARSEALQELAVSHLVGTAKRGRFPPPIKPPAEPRSLALFAASLAE